MPESNPQNSKSFESAHDAHNALEADIERLIREIAGKRNLPEHKDLSNRELVKQSLEPIFNQSAAPITTQPATAQSAIQNRILPNYLQNQNVPPNLKLQIEELVDSLFHQGVGKVVKKARRANPFVLDAFHDALTDKLHEELKKRGVI